MKRFIMAAALSGALLALGACDVEQTEEGSLPEVEVSEGNMPEYDVDAADVDVDAGTATRTVEVPTMDVDVDPADAGEPVATPAPE